MAFPLICTIRVGRDNLRQQSITAEAGQEVSTETTTAMATPITELSSTSESVAAVHYFLPTTRTLASTPIACTTATPQLPTSKTIATSLSSIGHIALRTLNIFRDMAQTPGGSRQAMARRDMCRMRRMPTMIAEH